MYHCTDCGNTFRLPETKKEEHNLPCPPYEKHLICPNCKSSNIKEREVRYCRCCGRTVGSSNDIYCCPSCRKQGEKIYLRQKIKVKQIHDSPIYKTVRLLEEYNKEHNTKLSYGEFTALVLPQTEKRNQKNERTRKNKTSEKI